MAPYPEQNMDRPLLALTIDKLEQLVSEHRSDRFTLGQVREELSARTTDRAKQLLREVEGLLSGKVPLPPKPGRPAQPGDQMSLMDDEGA